MKLTELLTADRIRIPLTSGTKEDVLRELVSMLPSHPEPDVQEQLLGAVLDRESRMSTGIGMGVAIPHGKSDLVDGMEVTFGISRDPIDYNSLDGEPVRVFFMLLSPPDHAGPHIKTLAHISRMLSTDGLRDGLSAVTQAEDAIELFRREEAAAED